ncbi:DUF2577 domain-containing protein [Mediterraneibacter gnavus]|uniref:DUF2577 domain-containing protein n=1 Tax=Mediterraneibacter gnavus TaxID=33038 RepID=UPI000C7A43E9|nr:DUF2577 domain-containing protein [Mediterraneibacter gnavus]PLT76276.1 hypothetical protein CDL24_11390 [Mediterraneibacter gnavus]
MVGDNPEKTSLKGMFQGMAAGETEVLQGIVKSASPLKIQIVNDEKLIIGPNITYVPRHLTNYTTSCSLAKGEKGSVYGPSTDGSRLTDFTFSGSITVHNALKAGEKVHVLSFNHGKQYYVLDRIS